MTANARREAIFTKLQDSTVPISATALAKEFSVTRQVIVGDIALLRAAGCAIDATARGYVIPQQRGLIRRLACVHSAEDTEAELNAMVDCGCTVIDVTVEHAVYGQITALLQLSSRYDVRQFVARMRSAEARPLSSLTEGIHLHTLSCPSEAAFAHLTEKLQEMGLLVEQ